MIDFFFKDIETWFKTDLNKNDVWLFNELVIHSS